MAVRKHNEFLEGYESEEDLDNGYDSEENEESRGNIAGRRSKRRRFELASDDGSVDEGQNDLENEPDQTEEYQAEQQEAFPDRQTDDLEDDDDANADSTNIKIPIPKDVAAAQKASRRTGVIYISRVPPFMKPQTLKHFLQPHAPKGIGRIFLTPEDHTAHLRRVKNGGNKKKSFTDGWVEFVSKRDAKSAVDLLNGNIIGGKKGNFYHDDLWSMKYLKGFKWNHLTEQIANENAERASRMREEIRRTRQENKAFIEDVERGKMLEGTEAKRKAKGGDAAPVVKKMEREFRQKPTQPVEKAEKVSEEARRVQRMIF